MFVERALERSFLGEAAPDTGPHCLTGEAGKQTREVVVAGGPGDRTVETNIVRDQGRDVGVWVNAPDLGIQLREVLGACPLRGKTRSVRFEYSADSENLEQRVVGVEIDDERDRFEEQPRFEARDIRPVAASDVENSDELESLHRFPHRAARQAQALREFFLRWQPRSRGQLAADDHVLYLLDRFVCDGHAPILEIRLHDANSFGDCERRGRIQS